MDFSYCELIDDTLQYYDYNEFIERRNLIRHHFKKLPIQGIRFYRWYVYANTHMNLTYKNLIWDYLQGDIDEDYLVKMQKRYKAF